MQKIIQFLLVLLLCFSLNVENTHANEVKYLPNIQFTNNVQIDFNARKFIDEYLQVWNDQAIDKADDYYTPDVI
jgi:hypothetical protein